MFKIIVPRNFIGWSLGAIALSGGFRSPAIVVSQLGGWSTPEQVNTQEFPTLAVDCHADPDRVVGTGEIAIDNGLDKAFGLARAVRPWFMYPCLRGRWMGTVGSNPGLFVVDCVPYTDPYVLEGHAKEQGAVKVVRTEYAFTVVH
jgi:hypothetical protein